MARVVKVDVRDLGWKAIRAHVKELDDRGVKVGVRAGSGKNNGVAIVHYATWNEFGDDTTPARPFMRRAVDTSEREFAAFAKSLAAGMIAGQINAEVALDRLGLWFQSRIQDTITSARSWAVPLSPVTIRRKKSSAPLIDKGMLRNAISYEKTRRR